MKRQIKSASKEEIGKQAFTNWHGSKPATRVVTISADVVIPADVDATEVIPAIENAPEFSSRVKFRVAACDVGGDVTDIYERDYPDEMYI